jgi:hypothetical protein
MSKWNLLKSLFLRRHRKVSIGTLSNQLLSHLKFKGFNETDYRLIGENRDLYEAEAYYKGS